MADKRLRKRSARLSESDPSAFEEPPKKRPKKHQTSPLVLKSTRPKRKERNGQVPPPSPASTGKQGRTTRKRQLLVSLNIQDHDLQVPGLGTPEKEGERGVVKGSGRQVKGKSRLKLTTQQQQQRDPSVVSDGGSSSNGSAINGRNLNFKNPNFTFSNTGTNKKKIWKNLKQMLAAEKAMGLGPNDPTYASIDAPPSFKPPKKYSDLSGLIAKYTDPLTGVYFSSTEEFQLIRTLPQDILQGYLGLRGKMTIT